MYTTSDTYGNILIIKLYLISTSLKLLFKLGQIIPFKILFQVLFWSMSCFNLSDEVCAPDANGLIDTGFNLTCLNNENRKYFSI